MKLLIIAAAVLVAWFFFLRKRSDAPPAADGPNELDYLNAQYPTTAPDDAPPPDNRDSGESLNSYSPLSMAIANAEGFGPASSIPTRANNPGDLELGDLGFGTLQAKGGNKITVFPSASDGWAALEHQVSKIFSGRSRYYTPDMSLNKFGSIYSGGSPTYGNNLADFLGLSPSSPLSQANGS